jgi:alkylhydroperoxidase family enzyme
MKREFVLVCTLISAWAPPLLGDEEPSNVPKAIPATRPEMKVALEALKLREPRIPLPPAKSSYLPASWGGGGGLGGFGQTNDRGIRDRRGRAPDPRLDPLFTDACFWVVSRGNNCHYCLGHQELKLCFGGMDDDTIAALDSDWTVFDPRQQAALAYARKLTLAPHLVGDKDIAALKPFFTDAQIIELSFNIARFNSVNRWTDAIGLPQERHHGNAGDSAFATPTSPQFQHTQSIVVSTTHRPRPPVAASLEQIQQAIAGAGDRQPRVMLPTVEIARRELVDVIADRVPFHWEQALAQLPVNGRGHVHTWNTILSDERLSPRFKAELAFLTAVNNQAWYAAAHAAHRLAQLGASPQDLTSLLGEHERSAGGAAAAYRLAAKLTTNPHLITDADIASVREHFSDAEAAQIIQVICMANLLDRFTEALGLPLEEGI